MSSSSNSCETRHVTVGILTVSDSCFAGRALDTSGENLKNLVHSKHLFHGSVLIQATVPDEISEIKEKLVGWCDIEKLDLILTTGGTGICQRDVTPEATRSIVDKEVPGLTLAMISKSLKVTPYAMLSRPVCGIRGRTLIINLPGSKKGSQECLQIVAPSLLHAVDLLREERKDYVVTTHSALQADGKRVESEQLHGQHAHLQPMPPAAKTSHHPCNKGEGHHHHHRHHHPHHHPHHLHHHHQHQPTSHSAVDNSKVARRPRESPFPMVSVQEALDMVIRESEQCPPQVIAYQDALGRILAEDVVAEEAFPPFRASVMDGYAVVASDGAGIRYVRSSVTAGKMLVGALSANDCVRISTGAPLPSGADSVVPVEMTELVRATDDGSEELEIRLLEAPSVGQHIRQIGSDIEKGEKILQAGVKLGPSELGLLATLGVVTVQCYKQPIVGVMSTGNELTEPQASVQLGKIRDSNRPMLIAALRKYNIPYVDMGIAKDCADALLGQLTAVLDKVDVVITSGGVSMGEKDMLKDIMLVDLQATLHFGRVFMKPGKPMTFATTTFNGRKKYFFCLPGNPVSCIVTYHLYVLPALRKMTGCVQPYDTVITAQLAHEIYLDARPEYRRCTLSWQQAGELPLAECSGGQMSSRLLSMRAITALMILPPCTQELDMLRKNQNVQVMMIDQIW